MGCCSSKDVPALSEIRHRLELQAITLTPDGSGGQAEAWATYNTVWGSLKPKVVKEMVLGQKLETRVEHEIFFRYVSGVSTDDRILFGSRVFQIKAFILVDELNEWIKIVSEEYVGT